MMKRALQGLWANKALALYFLLISLVAIGNGFSDSVYGNYFKEAYDVTAQQRGFLEIPRETPGIVCMFLVAALASLGDLKTTVIAHLLAFAGLLALSLGTPSFNGMMVLLFINSLGMHLFVPLQDSIGMDLSEPDNVGRRMGQYASVRSMVGFFAAIAVFFGFRRNVFSFVTPVKSIFLLGSAGFLGAALVSILLVRATKGQPQAQDKRPRRLNFVFRWDYKYYYGLAILQGVQKQITYVFGSWVVIDILGKRSDVMAVLAIASNLLSVFFMQWLGKIIDRVPVKRMMFVNAFALIFVYVTYAAVVLGITSKVLPEGIVSLGLVYALFILDRISIQTNVIRAIYLRSIAHSGRDVSATLSVGISLDHVVAIVAAPLCGIVWTEWGPHWVFVIAALFSLCNLHIARKIQPEQEAALAQRMRAEAGA